MARRDRRAEKKKKRRVVISLVIIFLMVFGFTLAAIVVNNPLGGTAAPNAQGQQREDLSYGDYEFETQNNYFVTEVNGRQVNMLFHPADTLLVNVPEEVKSLLASSPVMAVTFDPSSEDVQYAELARYQMTVNMDKQIYGGILKNSSQYDQPIITCAESSPNNPVVMLNSSNTTKITYDNGCVVVNGAGAEIVRAAERMIYESVGII